MPPFVFQVPPGWRDLTPGVPEANYDGVPPDVSAQIKKSNPLFFAADVAHPKGKFFTNVRATAVGGSGPVTEEALASYVGELQASGAKFAEKSERLEDWNGVTVGKIVGELTVADHPIAQVAYVVPGSDGRVFLTYSTLPEDLAVYAPVFDAAARATQGTIQPIAFLEKTGVRGTMLAFVGAVLLLVLIRRVRKRRAQAPS